MTLDKHNNVVDQRASLYEMVQKMQLEKKGKIDIVSKDRSIKLKVCIEHLLQISLAENEENLSQDEKEKNIFASQEEFKKIYALFYEQLLRVKEYKGLSPTEKIKEIDQFCIMFFHEQLKQCNIGAYPNEILNFILHTCASIFLSTAIVLFAGKNEYNEKEHLLLKYYASISQLKNSPKNIPDEFCLFLTKIRADFSNVYQDILGSLHEISTPGEVLSTVGIHQNLYNDLNAYGDTIAKQYIHVLKSMSVLRDLSARFIQNTDHVFYNKYPLTSSEEHHVKNELFFHEWKQILQEFDIDTLPEFAFKLEGKLESFGFIEIIDPRMMVSKERLSVEHLNAKLFTIILTKQVFTEKNIITENSSESIHCEFEMPGIEMVMSMSRDIGTLRVAGAAWNPMNLMSSPIVLAQELQFFPGGEEFAFELQVQIYNEIKKQLVFQKQQLVELTYEDENKMFDLCDDEAMEESTAIDPLVHENISGKLIKYDNKCYEFIRMPEGHNPGYKMIQILHEVKKQMDIPDHYTLKEIHPYAKHIGWKKVAQILKKYFSCDIVKDTASTHFKVIKKDNERELHSSILAPHRNKYSKHAAFGTITSILRKLHIDEEVFWNVVQGRFTPDQLINLNKEEYYERLKNISNKLI